MVSIHWGWLNLEQNIINLNIFWLTADKLQTKTKIMSSISSIIENIELINKLLIKQYTLYKKKKEKEKEKKMLVKTEFCAPKNKTISCQIRNKIWPIYLCEKVSVSAWCVVDA